MVANLVGEFQFHRQVSDGPVPCLPIADVVSRVALANYPHAPCGCTLAGKRVLFTCR